MFPSAAELAVVVVIFPPAVVFTFVVVVVIFPLEEVLAVVVGVDIFPFAVVIAVVVVVVDILFPSEAEYAVGVVVIFPSVVIFIVVVVIFPSAVVLVVELVALLVV